VLQCVAVCCSVLQCVAVRERVGERERDIELNWWHTYIELTGTHIYVRDNVRKSSVLQCVAVCCSVLQCVRKRHRAQLVAHIYM